MKRALVTVAMLTGCTSMHQPPPVVWFGHPAQVWALQSLQGERVKGRPGYVATVRLNSDLSVSGTRACNSISSAKLRWFAIEESARGGFDLRGQGAGITTTALCKDAAATATADRFWELMETARAWSMDQNELTIFLGDGSEARLLSLKDPSH